jgi:HEAT repeat protein
MKTWMQAVRILIGVVIAAAVLVGGIRVLDKTLGNNQPTLYHSHTLDYWTAQVSARDVTASNQANAILNAEIIPQLTNQMFYDIHDSRLRLALIDGLNHLPGIVIYYVQAYDRRAGAAEGLGMFGPAAKAAIPALMRAVQGGDNYPLFHERAVEALGQIHCEPEVVIPFLTKYLDDDDLNDEAATALAEFGSLARPAIPKILPLLHAADDDDRAVAADALEKIDPAAYTNAINGAPKQ